MKSVLTWFFLSCKRYLRRLSFLVILLLFPIGTMAFKQVETKESSEIRIAVCAEDEQADSLGRRLADQLAAYGTKAGQDGMFRFYLCDTEQEVEAEVISRRAECGYVIYEGLEERLDSGKFRRCIGVYSAPSTVTARMSTETVFSVMIETYDRTLLERYVAEGEALGGLGEEEARKQAAAEAGRLYDAILENQGTFRFEYRTAATGAQENQKAEASVDSIFPVRGLMAVFVFTTGLYGAVVLCKDEKRGLFLPLPAGVRSVCRLASLAAPVALSALSGLAALRLSGIMAGTGRELAAMAVYAAAVALFSYALKVILRSGTVICCLIPFFIIGSLVFCPVFLDAGSLAPEVETLGKLFLPYYYLRIF